MAFGTASDLFLRIALVAGAVATATCVLMLAAVAVLRLRLTLRREREQRFVEKWRPVIVRCIDAAPFDLPPLARADHESFLRLWNHYHESLRGPAEVRLNQMATVLGLHDAVRAMLGGGSLPRRLLAIVTLGNLKDRTRIAELRLLAEDPSPLVSLTAAQALLRIEPRATLAWLLPLAAARADWPLARLAAMLADVGADRISLPLAQAIKGAAASATAPAGVSRLLKLARLGHAGQVAATVRHVLGTATDGEIIAACLTQLSDPRDAALARQHASHPAWFVRVAAAKALGRFAGPGDRKLLAGLLEDPSWWVRYRAAQALAGLPFVRLDELRAIRAALPDRYAADMLGQVIAEHE